MTRFPAYVFALIAFTDLLAGAFAGWLVAKSRAVETRTGGADGKNGATAAAPNAGGLAEALPEMQGDLKAAEAEVASLKSRVADLESRLPRARTLEEKRAFAREVVQLLLREERDEQDRFLRMIPDLDAEMTAVFVEALKEDVKDGQKESLVYLVFECGGPDAAAYVNGLIEDPAGRKAEVNGLQRALSKIIRPLGFTRFKVDGPLLETARKLLDSTEVDRRFLGAGLLSYRDTDDARETLQRLAEMDTSRSVRGVALKSLCKIGTVATKDWLDRWERGLTTEEASEMREILDHSREELEFRLNR